MGEKDDCQGREDQMRIRSVQRIRQIVRQMLVEHDVAYPPIPVVAMTKAMNIEIRSEYFEGELSGVLYRDVERTIIAINKKHHPTRQRFTIAHELAHFLFHHGRTVFVDKTFAVKINLRNDLSSRAEDLEEIEANRFAAELVMPYDMIINDLDMHAVDLEQEDDEGVKLLCRRYDVSGQAMRFRIMNLATSPSR